MCQNKRKMIRITDTDTEVLSELLPTLPCPLNVDMLIMLICPLDMLKHCLTFDPHRNSCPWT